MKLMRLLSGILLILMMNSCATFSSELKNNGMLNNSNINLINGRYEILPIEIDTTNLTFVSGRLNYNLIQEFERNPFDPTIFKSDDSVKYTVELEIKNSKEFEISFLTNDKVSNSKIIEYQLKEDGFLYLDNDNFKIWGIPYLFGSMDLNKKRISIDNESNLILDVANFRGGAILLIIFVDGGRTSYRKIIKKVE